MLHHRTERTQRKNAERRKRLDEAVACLTSLDAEEASAMKGTNLFRWLCSMMKISGSLLSKARIGAMLDGDRVQEATVEEYRYLRACTELYGEFRHMADMSISLDEKYINRIYETLSEKTFRGYRSSEYTVREMNYRVPDSREIPVLMKAADREIASEEHYEDRVLGAVRTHDMILSIWPFEEKNGEVAYAAMSYELFAAGYPLPVLDISDTEHLRLSSEFVRNGSSVHLCGEVIDSLLDQCGGA